MNQSTFSWAEHPANPSPSQDSERDWMIRAATSASSFLDWLRDTIPAGCFGRTSPACCRIEQGRLAPSSEGWQNSGMGTLGQSWTLNTSESRNAAAACSLSGILEDSGSVARRYYLTPRACAGILRRAEKRGKDLPPALLQALKQVAGGSLVPENPVGKTQ